MARATIDRLTINSPYEEPKRHWRYDRQTRLFDLAAGRRPAGYVIASPDSQAFDDPGITVEIPLVNAIRPRVEAWREAGYPGTSTVTRRLLRHWTDPEEFDARRFFFCQIEAAETLIWLHEADLAPVIDGKPDVTRVATIELQRLAQERRLQRITFETAQKVYDELQPDWPGNRTLLIAQVVRLTERFLRSDRVVIEPASFAADSLKWRLLLTLNMTKVVQHVMQATRFGNTERLVPIFDRDHPIRSTGGMLTWYTGKPCEHTARSHVNACVYDSTWEASEAYALEHHPAVAAWVKNDHLGFEVLYVHNGAVHKYRPDFLIRLQTGETLILEVKGRDRDSDRTKRRYLREWVNAVNAHGGFGRWSCAVSANPGEIHDILAARTP